MTDPFCVKELKDALKKAKTRWNHRRNAEHLGACSRTVLLKIFNHSWMKGVVPAVWKEAVIILVPKKVRHKDPSQLPPFSLLSCVGKLLERMVNWRLISDLGPYAPQGRTPLLPKLSVTSKVSARTSYAWVGSRVHFRSSEDVTLLEFTSPVDREYMRRRLKFH